MIRALMLSALLLAGQATAADTASNPFGTTLSPPKPAQCGLFHAPASKCIQS